MRYHNPQDMVRRLIFFLLYLLFWSSRAVLCLMTLSRESSRPYDNACLTSGTTNVQCGYHRQRRALPGLVLGGIENGSSQATQRNDPITRVLCVAVVRRIKISPCLKIGHYGHFLSVLRPKISSVGTAVLQRLCPSFLRVVHLAPRAQQQVDGSRMSRSTGVSEVVHWIFE